MYKGFEGKKEMKKKWKTKTNEEGIVEQPTENKHILGVETLGKVTCVF